MSASTPAIVAGLILAACASQPQPKAEAPKAEAIITGAAAADPAPAAPRDPPLDAHGGAEADAGAEVVLDPSTQVPPSAPHRVPSHEELAEAKSQACAALTARVRTDGRVMLSARLRARGTFRDGDAPRFEARLKKALPAGAVTELQLINRGLPTWSMGVNERALQWLCKTEAIQAIYLPSEDREVLFEAGASSGTP